MTVSREKWNQFLRWNQFLSFEVAKEAAMTDASRQRAQISAILDELTVLDNKIDRPELRDMEARNECLEIITRIERRLNKMHAEVFVPSMVEGDK